MKETGAQNLLAAMAGGRRVTIGLESPEELRRLSDARLLTCPGCEGLVVLHAGAVRAHHFAHLPGAVCRFPHTEPETEEHRAGKLLLAQWLRARLPDSNVIVEAWLPETGQRADLLLEIEAPGAQKRRVALEYQCANLPAREWRRRHGLYLAAGIEDLWLLGGSRLKREPSVTTERGASVALRTTELERALIWDGAPLLFLDAEGICLEAGALARFRPDEAAQALRPTGRLSARPLLELDFPWSLLAWPRTAHPEAPRKSAVTSAKHSSPPVDRALWLREWLAQRFRVTLDTLPAFFGLPLSGEEALACDARLWQAALYYRFVHSRVGDGWWLREVETWSRAYLPLAQPADYRRLHHLLANYQEALAAAGLLTLPMGYGRVSAQIAADLTTLASLPDREEILRLVRYRRTLFRETPAEYLVTPVVVMDDVHVY